MLSLQAASVLAAGLLLAACGGASAPSASPATVSASTAAKPASSTGQGASAKPAASTATGNAAKPAASASAAGSAAGQPVLVRWGETTVSPTMPTGALTYLMLHPEIGQKYGVKFEFHAFAQGGPMYDAFRGGSLDMMDAGADSIATFAEQNIPVVGLKPWSKVPADWVIAVKKDSPYQKLSDLKGKRFVTLTTSGTSFFTPYLLFKKAGLNLKTDLQLVALPAPAIYSSILDGKADAGMFQNPNTERATASGDFRFIAHISDDLATAYNTPYFHLAVSATKKFYDANPKAAQGAITAFLDVFKNVSTHDLAQAIAADKDLSLGTPEEVQKNLDGAKGNMLLDVPAAELRSDLEKYYQLLKDVGAVNKPVDISTLYQLS